MFFPLWLVCRLPRLMTHADLVTRQQCGGPYERALMAQQTNDVADTLTSLIYSNTRTNTYNSDVIQLSFRPGQSENYRKRN
jgi:hypothetical protein